jgi:hypothetical protein
MYLGLKLPLSPSLRKSPNWQQPWISLITWAAIKSESVQIKGDSRALTYERINNEKGHMKAVRVLQTGEEIPV